MIASPSGPKQSPLEYDGGSPGTASGAFGAPANGILRQTPNSSPSWSSNHQIHSPVGSIVADVVPLARAVTWAVAPVVRSQL